MGRGRKIAGVVAAWLAVAGALTACAEAGVSSAAPPLEVCGHVVSSTAAGAVLTDASTKSRVTGIPTAGSAVFIKLAPQCQKGASVTFDPPGRATIVARAEAEDGKLVAVGVCMSTKGVARIVRADGSTSVVDLQESGVTC